MCGICGIVQTSGSPRPVVEPAVLDRMTDLMTHRGPDDRGTYLTRGAAIGVRRLSIVDVDGGHQPVSNEDGTVWAVQNGELYNHLDLRASLEREGHRFSSRCDTEVIPHLYERHGPSFPTRLRGKFGLAVWDERARCAVVARDRLGVKPVYYAAVGDVVVFASELKSVLASGVVPLRLDHDAIAAYLALGFVPGPLTPLEGVRKLMPGQLLIADQAGVRIETYWSYPEPRPPSRGVAADEYREGFRDALDEAVRLRLMSDVPLGAMLSGGLDSSVIVALMARHMREPVKTFSVGFAEAGADNELEDARLVAESVGADHHELELSVRDAVDLEDIVWHLDEPLADLSAAGFYAISELASRDVTVALSGQGADELLGGYPVHRNAVVARRWDRLPAAATALPLSIARRLPGRAGRAAHVLGAQDPAARMLAMLQLGNGRGNELVAGGPLAGRYPRAAADAVRARLGTFTGNAFDTTLFLDAQLGLVDDMLHYFDRASMAHSLEVRVPFLDHRLVEYCADVPAELKVKGGTGKLLLKELARGLVPDRVIDKPKVGFFNRAAATWLSAQMSSVVADYLLQPQPGYADLLDRGAVERLVREHEAGGHPRSARLLLAVLMLEIWLSSYLPRATARVDPIAAPAGRR